MFIEDCFTDSWIDTLLCFDKKLTNCIIPALALGILSVAVIFFTIGLIMCKICSHMMHERRKVKYLLCQPKSKFKKNLQKKPAQNKKTSQNYIKRFFSQDHPEKAPSWIHQHSVHQDSNERFPIDKLEHRENSKERQQQQQQGSGLRGKLKAKTNFLSS